MLGPIGVNQRSNRKPSKDLCKSWAVFSIVLMVHFLSFDKTFGSGEVRGGCKMVYVMVLKELCKLLRCKGQAIVHREQGPWPILRDKLKQVCT